MPMVLDPVQIPSGAKAADLRFEAITLCTFLNAAETHDIIQKRRSLKLLPERSVRLLRYLLFINPKRSIAMRQQGKQRMASCAQT